MAVAIVRSNTGSVNSGNLTLTLSQATTSGNTLFLAVGSIGVATTPSGFTLDVNANNTTDTSWANTAIFRKAITSGETSWAITLPSNGGGVGYVAEVSGLTASPLDQVAENNASGASFSASTGTTGTTAQADEWALAVVANASGRTYSSWTNGFTEVADLGNTATVKTNLGVATLTIASVGTYSTAAAMSPSGLYSGCIATYKTPVVATPTDRFMPFFGP